MKKISSVFIAAAILLCSCSMTREQRYMSEKQRIAAELEIAKTPIFQADSATNVVLRDSRKGITPLPDDLKTWLDAGIKAGWIGVTALGIYKLSDKIGAEHTTNNFYSTGVAE